MTTRRLPQGRITNNDNEDDIFDRLPDALLLVIFTIISDVKTLIRCRAVSKRFNLIVPQVQTLFLKLDHQLGSSDSLLSGLVKSLQRLITSSKHAQNSVAQIVSGFERVEGLWIEPPVEDLKVESGEFVKWKALFGMGLVGCIVVGMKSLSHEPVVDVGIEADEDVDADVDVEADVWMVNVLAVACDWHNAVKEVVRECKEMKVLLMMDKERKGSLVMCLNLLEECRNAEEWRGKSRVAVPAVRIVLWQRKKVKLGNGVTVEGPMVMVARPLDAVEDEVQPYSCCAEKVLARTAFDGMYGEIAQLLVQERYRMFEIGEF